LLISKVQNHPIADIPKPLWIMRIKAAALRDVAVRIITQSAKTDHLLFPAFIK